MKASFNADRARHLFKNMEDTVEAVLIVNSRMPFLDDNFRYLTDAIGGVFEGSIAIANPKGVTIITSAMEEQIARKTGCRIMLAADGEETVSLLRKAMRGREVVGVNKSGVSHNTMKWIGKSLKGVKLKDVSKQLSRSRMIKDEEEIERIRKAGKIASKVSDCLPEIVRPGMTEKEAATEIDYLIRKQGADGPAFDTIVAFGPASALPHHQPDERKLRKGSIALFDFGASFKNYKSDMTRTLFTKPLDRRMAGVYDIVANAQKAAISEIAPGVPSMKVDLAAREVIRKAGYAEYFIHSTGHGLGISEHDPGVISEKSKDILEENMVMTVEPGIYLPGKGGVRIEDDILITRKGRRMLTTPCSEKIVI